MLVSSQARLLTSWKTEMSFSDSGSPLFSSLLYQFFCAGLPLSQREKRIQVVAHTSSIREDLSVVLSNISFLAILVSGTLIVVGLVVRFASLAFYTKYYLVDDGSLIFLFLNSTAVLISCGMIGQLIGALLTPWFARKFEKHMIVLIVNLLHPALLFACYLTAPEAFGWILLTHGLGVLTYGITITLLCSMYTDCAEHSEWKCGKSSPSVTLSASILSLKAGSALGAATPGFVLTGAGFIANEIQTETAILGVRLAFNGVPAVCFALGALTMLLYKITSSTLHQVEVKLVEKRASHQR